MRGLLSNPFQRPAGQPSLNMKHPAARSLRLAVTAIPGGARDLLTGRVATNTTVGYEVNSLGPTIFPAVNVAATSFLGFPALVAGEVMTQVTLATIFQPRTFGVGQGLIGENTAGPTFKIQTGSTAIIQLVTAGFNLWSVPIVPGNNYFVAASFMKGPSPTTHTVITNMTTGQIWQVAAQMGAAGVTAGADYNVLTYNVSGGVNPGRLAHASLSATALNPGQLLAWAADPWSLWYDTTPSALMFSAGTHTAIIPPPPTGGLLANPFSYVSLATANATSVSTRPSALTGWDMINLSTTTRFVRVYNKSSAPVPASDSALIVARFAIPAGQRVSAQLGTNAGWLSAGLAFDITAAAPDTDATVTAAGDVIVNLFFE